MTRDHRAWVYVYPPVTPCMGIHPWNSSLGRTRCGYCGCIIVGGSLEVQRLDRAHPEFDGTGSKVTPAR